ncbi:MAG TPA: pyruvate kinase [Thermoanaerobaculia bacterium]|jgi:pyruvate kinase|nr:pyruvate kinase [Thermoanaerobaculia bacterium]
MERRAKIMATLGPVSTQEEILRGLIRAGVDLFRLNLSHGTHEEHGRTLQLVRRVAMEEKSHIPVVMDLMGPRYRLGVLPGEGRTLQPGEVLSLGTQESGADLPVDANILAYLETGERVLIDSGLVELKIVEKEGDHVRARVVNGGPVRTRKGINLPDTNLPFEISEKDHADIVFAVREGADFLAASYVGEASHLDQLRALVEEAGGQIPLVAKLERATAIEHLDDIAEAADGMMVARGDLGVEVPLYKVPVLQKEIIAAGRRSGKPVIVATQMLESMIEQPRPTRAEATDVANAVFDGADALMLSGETAIGKYPVEVVSTMARIIEEAESYATGGNVSQASRRPAPYPPGRGPARRTFELDPATHPPDIDLSLEVPDVVSAAAVSAADQLGVSRIVAFSQSGFTARLVARYRPSAPIVAFTPEEEVARRIQLVWGVRPLVTGTEVGTLDEVVQAVERHLLEAKLVAPGERIIILMGHPIRDKPLTNLMRVHRIRSR